MDKDKFYKIVKNNVDDSESAKTILKEIELDSFMPKQRTNQNGVIPYQLHQIELDKIIKNQSKYYPFLAEKNPVIDHRMASANKFIKRMTTKDTYLLGEDVLPANSLLYQKFTVLNELNNIRINNHRISVDVKQDVYKNLFKKYKTISSNKLSNYLKNNYNLKFVKITGLSDKSNNSKFNSSLATYYQLKHLNILGDKIDDRSTFCSKFHGVICPCSLRIIHAKFLPDVFS